MAERWKGADWARKREWAGWVWAVGRKKKRGRGEGVWAGWAEKGKGEKGFPLSLFFCFNLKQRQTNST